MAVSRAADGETLLTGKVKVPSFLLGVVISGVQFRGDLTYHGLRLLSQRVTFHSYKSLWGLTGPNTCASEGVKLRVCWGGVKTLISSGRHGKPKGPGFELDPLDLVGPHCLFSRQLLTSLDSLVHSFLRDHELRAACTEGRLPVKAGPSGSQWLHPAPLPCGVGNPTGQQHALQTGSGKTVCLPPRGQSCCQGAKSVPSNPHPRPTSEAVNESR